MVTKTVRMEVLILIHQLRCSESFKSTMCLIWKYLMLRKARKARVKHPRVMVIVVLILLFLSVSETLRFSQ